MGERKLVGTNEMFKKALAGGYAIGAYNVNNMEILQGIAEAAEETQSPIILQVSAGARKYANQTYLIKLVEAALATTTTTAGGLRRRQGQLQDQPRGGQVHRRDGPVLR